MGFFDPHPPISPISPMFPMSRNAPYTDLLSVYFRHIDTEPTANQNQHTVITIHYRRFCAPV